VLRARSARHGPRYTRRMPIYEYACAGCAETFEELVSAAASDDVRCPHCASGDVTRLLSQFARPAGAAPPVTAGGGGGCCGGGCGCC
jgi:putative FmdB family regulatory protein